MKYGIEVFAVLAPVAKHGLLRFRTELSLQELKGRVIAVAQTSLNLV